MTELNGKIVVNDSFIKTFPKSPTTTLLKGIENGLIHK